ncbi:hypothetical protein DFH09DRAFT_63696 [Mycena vulgaris]|nr:hypothetical protein DFH09DRAFT_63696 [Mycena vulgaris]
MAQTTTSSKTDVSGPRILLRYLSRRIRRRSKPSEYPECLASLPWLPQDILAEICANMVPQDLYNLSRTTKSLRTFLTSRSNAGPIWRRAVAEAVADDSFPPLSPFIQPELQWTQFICGEFCLICGSEYNDPVPGMHIYWAFNARYCARCLPLQVQTRLPKRLEKCLPRHEWRNLFPCAPHPSTQAPLYSSWDIKVFTKQYFSLPTPDVREACVQRQRERTEAILSVNSHSFSLVDSDASNSIARPCLPGLGSAHPVGRRR